MFDKVERLVLLAIIVSAALLVLLMAGPQSEVSIPDRHNHVAVD